MRKNSQSQSVLERIFTGNSAKILDHLTTFKGFEYTVKEICNILGISRRVAMTNLKTLEENDLVQNSKFRPIKWSIQKNEQTELLRNFIFTVATKNIERAAKH